MRIIKPATVRDWALRHADAASAIEKWMVLVEDGGWKNFAELRKVFPSADSVVVESERQVVVFNIGGNKYRLIAAIHFETQILYAMLFLTHAEYDKDKWKKVL